MRAWSSLVFAVALASVFGCGTPLDENQAGVTERDGCEATGCSGEVCAESSAGVATACEWKAEYACYRSAECARQSNGTCGWTPTAELAFCLASS